MPSVKPSAELSKLVLADGTPAEILETNGNQVVLSTESSAPPGARLALLYGESEHFNVKVQRCKKIAESGKFRIEARFIDLSRVARAKLLGLPQ